MEISTLPPSSTFVRDLYARMLLTRLVDDCARRFCEQEQGGLVVTCRGHEAAQVGSAICIEVGTDFTLPYYRDLGVVLTIGMTPYEVFRTYTQLPGKQPSDDGNKFQNEHEHGNTSQRILHWGYHKHNMVTGSVPVATQVLHAAGIAFASKLRKAPVVTVAYCGDGAACEPDFLEGITFAAQHQLPAIFVYEQDAASSLPQTLTLPAGLEYQCIDGMNVVEVYAAMQTAMRYAREGNGPVLLEMTVRRSTPTVKFLETDQENDLLQRCQRYLEEQGMWDQEWARQLHERLSTEVEQAMQSALREP